MSKLLRYLLLVLFPHVDPGEEEDPPQDDADEQDEDIQASGDGGADDSQPDDTGAGEDPPQRAPSRREKAVIEARERAQAAERKADEAMAEVKRLQTAQAAPDRQFADEEAKLRDPATTELEKWQIQSNRALRQSQQQSQAALAEARDMADRTMYAQKALTSDIHKKYQDKVEDILQQWRKNGQNPPREFLLHLAIGKDVAEGKFKDKPGTKQPTIPRGRTPGARSDVPRSGGRTEAEKRRARLQDQPI